MEKYFNQKFLNAQKQFKLLLCCILCIWHVLSNYSQCKSFFNLSFLNNFRFTGSHESFVAGTFFCHCHLFLQTTLLSWWWFCYFIWNHRISSRQDASDILKLSQLKCIGIHERDAALRTIVCVSSSAAHCVTCNPWDSDKLGFKKFPENNDIAGAAVVFIHCNAKPRTQRNVWSRKHSAWAWKGPRSFQLPRLRGEPTPDLRSHLV